MQKVIGIINKRVRFLKGYRATSIIIKTKLAERIDELEYLKEKLGVKK